MTSRDCPVCLKATATHATQPGLRLCASCWARMIATVREGRP